MTPKFCSNCGAELVQGVEICLKCHSPVFPTATGKKQYPKDTPENRARKMREYKVIVFDEVADAASKGKYDKTRLETTLNSLGLEGWSLKKTRMRQIPGLVSSTIEFIMIFERDMPLEA